MGVELLNKVQSYFGKYEAPDFLYNFYRESGQVLFLVMLFTKESCCVRWSSSTLAVTKAVVYCSDEDFPEQGICTELESKGFVVHNLSDVLCPPVDIGCGRLYAFTYKASTAIMPQSSYLVLRQSLQTCVDETLRNYGVSPLSVLNDISLESFCRYIFGVPNVLTDKIGVNVKFAFSIKNGTVSLTESDDAETQFMTISTSLFDTIKQAGGTNALCAYLEQCEGFDAAAFRTVQGALGQRRIWSNYCNKYLLSVAKSYATFWVNVMNGQ